MTNLRDRHDGLIREIFEEHGISVGRDDPILVLHTINRRLALETAAAQQELLERLGQELQALTRQWSGEANLKAERILTAAIDDARRTAEELLRSADSATTTALQREIDDALARLTAVINDAHRLALFNVAASCITLLAAAIALLSLNL